MNKPATLLQLTPTAVWFADNALDHNMSLFLNC